MTEDQTTTPEPAAEETKPKKLNPVDVFCKRSGYQPSDVVAYNLQTRVFVTGNGGKYELSAKGGGVRVLQGPPTPNQEG